MQNTLPYQPKHKIRIVTAAALFDGHDAAINLMRRIMQSAGAEVIHLGHNRSAQEIVECAIQEDVQAIAITSYQGGHVEFFKYMYDLLKKNKAEHIKIFGGGGGTILPEEIDELRDYGISRIYSPDDGRAMGLQGMINDLLAQADFPSGKASKKAQETFGKDDKKDIAQLISAIENQSKQLNGFLQKVNQRAATSTVPVLGITGTGGAGKSSLVDELVRRFLDDFKEKTLAIVSVDPSRRRTGGALLGDRIRMNAIFDDRVYMRSVATRQSNLALSRHIRETVDLLKSSGFDLVILESSGIGQSDTEIVDYADVSLYVMTPEYGAATQLEKIDMLDYADLIAINKFDKRGAQDALRDVRKQFQRNRQLWEASPEMLPVYGTMASQFRDPGTDKLYLATLEAIHQKTDIRWHSILEKQALLPEKPSIVPPDRVRYLAEIAETIRQYDRRTQEQADMAGKIQSLQETISLLPQEQEAMWETLQALVADYKRQLDTPLLEKLEGWDAYKARYSTDKFEYDVRGKTIQVDTSHRSLSGTKIPKVALPKYSSWRDITSWLMQENVPGEFPFSAGVFPFKRKGEDPTRMFAGEGNPERTNRRFHYLSEEQPAARLSTAFDSVTLYGEDPALRPDIYGKIGNSGVNVCCLDDAKKLYSGFNLAAPNTSVSMTINGPAAAICAYFMNTAIDQQCELYILENGLEDKVRQKIQNIYQKKQADPPMYHGELPKNHDKLGLMLLGVTGDQVLPHETYEKIKADTLKAVRGTVQADILKEDQAQNTCIFSTEFSLRLMGDMQQYFIDNHVQNFYSVSVSGYHIAEAGANPITQLAFTLANGFTFVEYYLSRGMEIDRFARNFSFFFSNGVDPEYAVIGRVARRIWAKALKFKYGAGERAQKLKYHIQTSGRSLHAQEISFNDIRTTLQALYAIYDNCNSLHTNAYDEAITTPTEESVRRAMAIQLIINKELGLNKNENPLQGSFIIEELTDLVEEAVMAEFDRLTERGGALGAMETMYQRTKIQEESMHYETLKHTGEYPVVGVNTFLSSEGSPTVLPKGVIRSTETEKKAQIATKEHVQNIYEEEAESALQQLCESAKSNENLFENLMDVTKFCTLGQITHALFKVGGRYRRNM